MSTPLASTAYFNGNFMPLAEANVNVMTHALNYGTACFEGIRGYWNEEQQQLYLFRMREHYERLVKSCRILTMKAPGTPEELGRISLEMLRRDNPRHDVYVRPLVYKSSLAIGVRLHNVDDGFVLFYALLGKYIDNQSGCRCCTSTYRRVDDNGIPARAKITGIYVNSALAKSEAELNGFDEAIMLTHEGHVSEGSGENIFLIIDGQLVTPAPSENILMGITRASVMELAKRELGIDTIERQVDRTELYIADEVFMTGTAAEITPVGEVDRRPVGSGGIGPVTAKLQELFFRAVKSEVPAYTRWCTPVYQPVAASREG